MKCKNCGCDTKKVKRSQAPSQRRLKIRPGQFDHSSAEAIETSIKQMVETKEHYVHISNKLREYYELTGYAERTMAAHLSISKSEIHRLILIAYMSDSIKHAAISNDTEKYVLLEWDELKDPQMKNYFRTDVIAGTIKFRRQLKKRINKYAVELGQMGPGDSPGLTL